MKIFLDTAKIKEIKTAMRWGVLKGLTTNPSIISKEDKHFRDIAGELCSLVDPYPVSLEVVSREADGMVEQARSVAKIAGNAVIKLPTNPEGLSAQAVLCKEGIKTNLTLIFSTSQAILASCANATYLSPFIGRLEDRGYDGIRLINDLMEINRKYGFSAEVIAASIRDPHQVIEVAKTGVHIVTMPFAVLEKMLANTMTDMDLNKFLSDWENVPGKDEAFN